MTNEEQKMKTTEELFVSLALSAKELEACATFYGYITVTEDNTPPNEDEKPC